MVLVKLFKYESSIQRCEDGYDDRPIKHQNVTFQFAQNFWRVAERIESYFAEPVKPLTSIQLETRLLQITKERRFFPLLDECKVWPLEFNFKSTGQDWN